MIKNINLNNEITDRINNRNSKFFYKIPNHNGTKFSLSSFLYISTNVFNYLHFKNNQIVKDEDKFLVKKSRLKKYLENNIIEIYSNTSKYHNCDYW